MPNAGLRARFARIKARTAPAQLVAASVLVTLAVISAVNAVSPQTPRLSDADVRAAIRQGLASATPKPNVAVDAYEHVKRSVVTVRTRRAGEAALQARGAGVLLDTGGRVVTSLHVVAGADEVSVVFFDGSDAPALVSATDATTDIALLVAAGIGQVPAVLASPKSLRVGDEALIVGSPFGLGGSLSAGVVSGLHRTFQPAWSARPLDDLIQFDAAVLSGHEGGPLINRRGEVIGIVIANTSPAGLSVPGIGFAVPINALSTAAGNTPF